MTHGKSKIAVPVSTMEAITLIKIHDPGNVGQEVVVNAFDATAHVVEFVFFVNFVLTSDRRVVPSAGRDDKFFEKDAVFEGIDALSGQNDHNLFALSNGWLRNRDRNSIDEQYLIDVN